MASMRRARQVILGSYIIGVLIALAFLAAQSRMQDMAGLVLMPLATASAVLLAIALGVGSLLGTGALVRTKALRAYDLLTVTLGWVGAIGFIIYAAAFWWH